MTVRSSRRWVRPVVGLVLTIAWFAVAGLGGPYFGRIDEVAVNDQASYLPSSAESTQVQKRLTDFFGGDTIPAVVVAERAGGLTIEDQAWLAAQSATLPEQVPAISGGVSPALPSADGMAAQIFVPLSTSADVTVAVADLRASLDGAPEGLAVYVTGAAGLSADLGNGFAGVDGLLLLVAVAAVLIILVVVYRSPLLPIMVLFAAVSALCAAVVTNFYLAKAGVFKINAQVQGILFILVIGAATDYSLLYVSRFREALRENRSVWSATTIAWKGSVEPIVASGGTVIAGLLCLLLSDLASNKALGPVAAIGLVFAVLAALTFVPAMLLLAGRVAFWPRHTDYAVLHSRTERRSGWVRIAGLVRTQARPIWIVVGILLVLGSVGIAGLKADGVPASDLLLGQSQAREGQNVLAAHFPGGSGQPVQVIVPQATLGETAALALENPGVSSASVVSADSPSGSIPIPAPPQGPLAQATPTVSDGDVMLLLTLKDTADSRDAEQTVTDLRTVLHSVDSSIKVGGPTATSLDSNLTSTRDRNLIIPVVLVVITLDLDGIAPQYRRSAATDAHNGLEFRHSLGRHKPVLQQRARIPRLRPVGAALRVRVLGGPRHRLQHLPDDPDTGGVPGSRNQGGRVARTRRHRGRDHVGGRRVGRDLRGSGRDPHTIPGAARDNRRLRRAARCACRARLVRAGTGARCRRQGLVAFEARRSRTGVTAD